MPLTPEEIKELKAQLSEQIKHLPEDKRRLAQEQIDSMSPESLEIMLEQQKMAGAKQPPKKEIFRAIVSSEIPAVKIDENKSAIAVMEINPVSQAHTIIIPKKQIKTEQKIPTQAFNLAKKVGQRICKRLNAKSVSIQTEKKFEECIINIIPEYEEAELNKQKRVSIEELEQIAKKIRPQKRPKKEKIKVHQSPAQDLIKINRRIP